MSGRDKRVIYTLEDLREFVKEYRKRQGERGMRLGLKDLIFQDPEKNKMIERK